MNDFVKQRKGNDGKNGFQKDLLKDSKIYFKFIYLKIFP